MTQTTKDQATARPWRMEQDSFHDYLIEHNTHKVICEITGLKTVDKKAMLLAVNSHDKLVEAVKYALEFINTGCPKFDQIHTGLVLEGSLKDIGA